MVIIFLKINWNYGIQQFLYLYLQQQQNDKKLILEAII